MPFKTQQEIDELHDNLYSIVFPMLSDFENKTWQHKAGTDLETTGLVYKGHHEKIGTVWKIDAILDISAEEYVERFILGGELPTWVPHLSKNYVFLERGEGKYDWNVTYSEMLGFGTISTRDWVCINFHELLADGSHLCMTIAIDHPDAPKNTGYVRGEHLPSGTILRPCKDNPNRCELFWANNTDLKGYLPRALINMVMANFMVDFGIAAIGKANEIAASKKQ